MLYMVTFTINIPQMLAYIIYIPYMDPIREYIHEVLVHMFITSRGFPTWEPEGQRAGQGKTPRSFQILPCGNLRTSSVSPK